MSMTMLAAQFRRVRIRSFKDFLIIIVAGLIIYAIQLLLQKQFGWDEHKARNVATVLGIVLVIIFVFASISSDN